MSSRSHSLTHYSSRAVWCQSRVLCLPSLTDCLSFVMMRRLKIETAVATDEHFRQEGFATLPWA
jgi:hypothetical protein